MNVQQSVKSLKKRKRAIWTGPASNDYTLKSGQVLTVTEIDLALQRGRLDGIIEIQ